MEEIRQTDDGSVNIRILQQFRGGAELPRDMKEAVGQLNKAYDRLQQARVNRDAAGEAEARAEVDGFWGKSGGTRDILVARGLAEPAAAESTYLLALCKHEAAVRTARATHAPGAGPCQTAGHRGPFHLEGPWPGRLDGPAGRGNPMCGAHRSDGDPASQATGHCASENVKCILSPVFAETSVGDCETPPTTPGATR